jgi:hypothetical protein
VAENPSGARTVRAVSDLHSKLSHDLPVYQMARTPKLTSKYVTHGDRPYVYMERSQSGRCWWYWRMIHPLWPGATVNHGPFLNQGIACDDARNWS